MSFATRWRERGRARLRTLVGWAAVLVLGASLAGAALFPVFSGRTEAPTWSRAAAERALDAARKVHASRWAPAALLRAESATRAALAETRRQEVRFLLLRDFRAARASLLLAEEKSKAAASEAARRREEARAKADEAIADAGDRLGTADGFADAMHLGRFQRSVLQRAKVALAEAKILHGRDEFETAAERAKAASASADLVGDTAADAMARFGDSRLVRHWKQMTEDTIRWSRLTGEDAIVVYKDEHRLTLYSGGRPIKSYRAELGYNSIRDKLHAGDAATPEGRYRITAKRGPSQTTYYKALLLNYPNDEDRAAFERARRAGRLPRWARLGGLIEIHGEGGKGKDWTKGCVALRNAEMDDLFGRVGVGTPVTIVGGDGGGGTYTELVRRHRSPGNGTTSQ